VCFKGLRGTLCRPSCYSKVARFCYGVLQGRAHRTRRAAIGSGLLARFTSRVRSHSSKIRFNIIFPCPDLVKLPLLDTADGHPA
jgi:hypothetical protein